ncbi:MAG: DUF5658 family protein [Candidatus Binatia bacterium]
MAPPEHELRQLLALNVLLQLFDGLVTYQALQIGMLEGNPIVRASFPVLGIGTSLLLFKAQACGFLVLLRRSVRATMACDALRLVAVVYALASLAPWLGKLLPFAAALD